MRIREASLADYADMQALQIDCVRGLEGVYPGGVYTAENMEEWIRRINSREPHYGDCHSFVAVDDADIITGFVAWNMRYTSKIQCLYVAEEHRHRGLGSTLLHAAEVRVTIPTIELRATLNAQPFYENQGYSFIRYPHDALVPMALMQKQL